MIYCRINIPELSGNSADAREFVGDEFAFEYVILTIVDFVAESVR